MWSQTLSKMGSQTTKLKMIQRISQPSTFWNYRLYELPPPPKKKHVGQGTDRRIALMFAMLSKASSKSICEKLAPKTPDEKLPGSGTPWDCYIYLHEWLLFMVNVSKLYHSHGRYGYLHLRNSSNLI